MNLSRFIKIISERNLVLLNQKHVGSYFNDVFYFTILLVSGSVIL